MARFCPKCGATDKDFYEGFCIDCYAKMHKFTEFPERFEVATCKYCAREIVPIAAVLKKVKTKLHRPEFSISLENSKAVITVKGFIDKKEVIPITEKGEVELLFKERTCEACYFVSASYWEAKLQLRKAEKHDPVLLNEVERYVKRHVRIIARTDPHANAWWMGESREGPDYYFSYKEIGKKIVELIRKDIGAKPVLVTKKFKGFKKKTGGKKFQITYCYRL